MVEIEPVLVGALKKIPALAGFLVRGATEEQASKFTVPAVEVGFGGLRLGDMNAVSASFDVAWEVRLILVRSSTAAQQIGLLTRDIVLALHGFAPGKVEDQFWSRFKLSGAHAPESIDQGLTEFILSFETSAVYRGHQS